jgi:ribosome-associated protein
VTSQRTRSQELNRADVLERFVELLRAALYREPPRIPTRVSRAAKNKRVEEKKKRTEIKVARSRKDWDA